MPPLLLRRTDAAPQRQAASLTWVIRCPVWLVETAQNLDLRGKAIAKLLIADCQMLSAIRSKTLSLEIVERIDSQ